MGLTILVTLLGMLTPAAAQDGSPALAERGISLEAALTVDVISNLDGGIQTGTVLLENLDLVVAAELEQLLGWKGATAFLYCLVLHGGDPSSVLVGDFQVVSNIDAPNSVRLFEAWIEQWLLDGRLSLKLGLYDLNSEFDVNETGALFLSSSHGIGPDISQSGANGPSIFPYTALGFRLRATPSPGIYAQVAALDAVPGDLRNEDGTHIHLSSEEGALVVGEVGKVFGDPELPRAKVAIGGWHMTKKTDESAAGVAIRPTQNRGAYLLIERRLHQETNDPSQGLAGHLRLGKAKDEVNQVGWYLGAGLVYSGPFAGRGSDQIGLAVGHARTSGRYRDDMTAAGVGADSHETNVELSYLAQLTPWLTIQPDLQLVMNPGMDPALSNAVVAGVRFGLAWASQ